MRTVQSCFDQEHEAQLICTTILLKDSAFPFIDKIIRNCTSTFSLYTHIPRLLDITHTMACLVLMMEEIPLQKIILHREGARYHHASHANLCIPYFLTSTVQHGAIVQRLCTGYCESCLFCCIGNIFYCSHIVTQVICGSVVVFNHTLWSPANITRVSPTMTTIQPL